MRLFIEHRTKIEKSLEKSEGGFETFESRLFRLDVFKELFQFESIVSKFGYSSHVIPVYCIIAIAQSETEAFMPLRVARETKSVSESN